MSDSLMRSELNNLERKLILMLNKYQKLKQENEVLKDEVLSMKKAIVQKDEELEGFYNKDKISKIVNGMDTGESSSGELGEMLDEYIKEVDKCIAQLSE